MRLTVRLVAALSLCAAPALAQGERVDGEDPTDREMQAEAPDRPKDMPLSLLPEPPAQKLPSPRPAAIEALDGLLAKIADTDAARRERAAESLVEAKTDWTAAIERRADQLADRADRKAMKSLFEDIRKSSNNAEGTDYLDDILDKPDPANPHWQHLVQLFAMNRMLTAIGTHEAAGTLVFIYSRFGEFVRIDVQRQLDEMGDRSTSALIEAQRHPAPKIAEWASRLLRLRNQDKPHDAVKTKDTIALADILVALGRTRDPEVASILLSYAASDQPGVQKAARQGLALLGDVGSWQLKDAYLNITGKSPPRDWTWKRTARELFTEYDRLRMEEAYALFEQGQKAAKQSDWSQMAKSYNELIAKLPEFARKDEVAAGYLQAAEAAREKGAEPIATALLYAVRAEQLAEDENLKRKSEALRRLLSAQRLKQQGWLDSQQLKRARALDPDLSTETEQLGSTEAAGRSWGSASRYLVALAVVGVALAGVAWIVLSTLARRKTYQITAKSPSKKQQAPEATKPAEAAPAVLASETPAPDANNTAPDAEHPADQTVASSSALDESATDPSKQQLD